MTTAVPQHVALPRWQRMLLPGELRDGARGRRTARDWVVDLAMFAIAAGLSALVLGATARDHSELEWVIDVVLGAVAFAAMWLRRSHPLAVGLIAGGCSLVSGPAGGPPLLALFNVAARGPRPAIPPGLPPPPAPPPIFPLFFARGGSYGLQPLL